MKVILTTRNIIICLYLFILFLFSFFLSFFYSMQSLSLLLLGTFNALTLLVGHQEEHPACKN